MNTRLCAIVKRIYNLDVRKEDELIMNVHYLKHRADIEMGKGESSGGYDSLTSGFFTKDEV